MRPGQRRARRARLGALAFNPRKALMDTASPPPEDHIRHVLYLIGASAYACITTGDGRKVDILLQGGKSGQNSLRAFATTKQREAARAARTARLARDAADWLDRQSGPTFRRAGE
jgi:hypothetical protein